MAAPTATARPACDPPFMQRLWRQGGTRIISSGNICHRRTLT